MIDQYSFGSITIDGKTYNYDIEIRSTGEILSWQRKQGHIISFDDIERAIRENPEIIVIGTGYSGVAEVDEEIKKELPIRKINLIIEKTTDAVEIFNSLIKENKKVIGLFHLTC